MSKKEKIRTEKDKEKDAQVHETHEGEVIRDQSPEEASGQGENNMQNDITGSDKTAVFEQTIEELQGKLEEANDKFLRLFSEFDNYRKRVTRERIELSKTAAENIIVSLLPVLDDLERASKTVQKMQDKDLKDHVESEGILLIYNKFKNILKQKGVEEIPAEGHDFDTDYHEAITHMPAPEEHMKGKVMEEVQKGYLLNGKVIRFARVVVAN
ncbi:MAG: nucleotide exchange factor GrpE [Bacteroidia bacterium]|nr:MAG: nucleotide exchange factor GrpE [Bacteroidia bacterium]